MHIKEYITPGKKPQEADKAVIMIHGRNATAQDIAGLSAVLNVADFAIIAPQATNYSWYPKSFIAPVAENEPWLSSAIEIIGSITEEVNQYGIPFDKIYFVGFSQGACLSLEFVTRHARRWGGVVAFTGGLIGDKIYMENYKGDFEGTPVFIGSADPDTHVPVERVRESVKILRSMNADVTEKIYPGMGHTINKDEVALANKLIFK